MLYLILVIGNPTIQGRHLHISSEIGKVFVFSARCLIHRVFLHKAVNQDFEVLLIWSMAVFSWSGPHFGQTFQWDCVNSSGMANSLHRTWERFLPSFLHASFIYLFSSSRSKSRGTVLPRSQNGSTSTDIPVEASGRTEPETLSKMPLRHIWTCCHSARNKLKRISNF